MHIWRTTKYVEGYLHPYDAIDLGFFTNMSYAVRAAFKEINRMSHEKQNTIFSVKDIHFLKDELTVIIDIKQWEDETDYVTKSGNYDYLDKYGRAVFEFDYKDYIVISTVPIDNDI